MKPSGDSCSEPLHNLTPSVFKISFKIAKETFRLINLKGRGNVHIFYSDVYIMLHRIFTVGLWLLNEHNYILTSELLKTCLLMTLNVLHSEINIEWHLI
jgi:hypothetical protein